MQNSVKILNSNPNDIDLIFDFYDMAVAIQKKVFNKHWQGFDRFMVAREIAENRQFKIVVNEQVACIFAITFSDQLIWQERDQDPSVYIHRIVTHTAFKGYGFVKAIIEWGKELSKTNKLKYIRLDTWADNKKLLQYYTGCGFRYAGAVTMKKNKALPKHYEGISLNLFEIDCNL